MKAEITCKCSRCKLTLNYATPSLSLLCACEDCQLALVWGFQQGGAAPTVLPHLFYIRSGCYNNHHPLSGFIDLAANTAHA